MYQQHWGLRKSPFPDGHAPRFFDGSEVHEEALARMHYLVDERRRLGLLLGGAGTGKSLLLNVFLLALRHAGTTSAKVNLQGIDRRELLWQVAIQWGANPAGGDDALTLWRRVNDRLVENRLQSLPCVLLADNAEGAFDDVRLQVVQLVQSDPVPDSPLTAIVSTRPSQLDRLDRRLLDLAVLRIDLAPWDQGEALEAVDREPDVTSLER